MAMNALQKALVTAGLAKEPKEKKKNHKQFKCNKCGTVMVHPDNVNVMWCPQCQESYFIFSKK